MVCTQRQLCHPSVKCTRESQFEQRRRLISSPRPFSLRNQLITRKHLSDVLSGRIIAIAIFGAFRQINTSQFISDRRNLSQHHLPTFLGLYLKLSRDKLWFSPWENQLCESPMGPKTVLRCVQSASLCHKYIIPKAQKNWRSQDSALLHAKDVSDNQLACCFVSAGFSTSQQSLCFSCRHDPFYAVLSTLKPTQRRRVFYKAFLGQIILFAQHKAVSWFLLIILHMNIH